MRLLLATLLCLSTAPAMAACPLVLNGDWGDEIAAEAQQAICLQGELSARLVADQHLAQLKADDDLRLMLLEMEQQFKAIADDARRRSASSDAPQSFPHSTRISLSGVAVTWRRPLPSGSDV